MEGPAKHSGKDYWFSADVLTAKQVAETLAEATGRKFTAAVRTAEAFQSEAKQPGSIFEPAYAKGGLEFFRYVDDRSEEHTSELQSRLHLVCRLLLEKKKTK